MARRPNYQFERHERAKAKAAKKAAKLEEKLAKRKGLSDDDTIDDSEE